MKTRAEANGATVRSVERACDILGTFRREDEVLRLRELATRVSLDESTVLPLLKTLIGRNFIERVPPHHYRSHIKLNSTRQITVGYAAQSTEFAFSHEVTEGAIRAAEANGVRLIVTDNRYSKTAALKNAIALIEQRVDLVIEFQTDQHVAPVISSKYQETGIPVIAIDIPLRVQFTSVRIIIARVLWEAVTWLVGHRSTGMENSMKFYCWNSARLDRSPRLV